MNLRHVFSVGAALAFAAAARAQTTTGTVRGYVKDPNGQALGGAQVEARNTETGRLARGMVGTVTRMPTALS